MKKILLSVVALFATLNIFADAVEGVYDFNATTDSTALVWNIPLSKDKLTKDTLEYTDGVNKVTLGAVDGGSYYFNNLKPAYWALFMGKKGAFVETSVTYNVAKIVVTGASGASANTIFKVFVGETEIGTHTGSKDEWEVTVPAVYQAANTVFKIQVSSSHNAQITKLEFVKAVAGAPDAPTFSVVSGTYTSAQTVELATETEGAEIFYTLDGTDPTAESTKYTAALTISETTTVKAVAIKAGVASTVESATYTIVKIEGEGTKEKPFTVADVKLLNNPGTTAWVEGPIYGVYSNNKPTTEVGTVATNLALGIDEGNCIPVELPKGDVRTALNLVDNPTLAVVKVKVYGTLVAYFSTTGVKNVTEYEIVSSAGIKLATDTAYANSKLVKNGRLVIVNGDKQYNTAGQLMK